MYRDNQETDNIRIIDQADFDIIQRQFLGSMFDQNKYDNGLVETLNDKSQSINTSAISVEALSNIFTGILERAGFDIGKLYNSKISIDGGPYGKDNFNDGTDIQSLDVVARGSLKGQMNPENGEPYTFTGNAPNGTIKVTAHWRSNSGSTYLTSVSNVISALGVHEFVGHGVRKLNDTKSHHQIIYI